MPTGSNESKLLETISTKTTLLFRKNKLTVDFVCPRNERYRVPKHIVQGIRDKRKSLLHGPFSCPNCGKDQLMIQIDKNSKKVIAACPCGVEQELKFVPVFEAVDYFSKFVDQFRKK